ncbi:unnamed protein product [Rotaria socialis]|uniref:Uncharacterized protein n=1 Tax=Rotaria socialis TaxID=392032 RepID=A0A818S6V8_9BILA|nr:unnamed protein product [Rotaria socialis]CAF3358175.1 unnamed protein product [Rotaria socialis]CAF3358382.1 unnamed protein product [Rotaria socialis]CAF3575960.1 unnamed protein product [Rotaria socialis]CAF3662531.1 unnamed protein product [Rotaria socialis]
MMKINRDLLAFPMPQWHLNNWQLIKLPLFWAVAIYATRMLNRQLEKKLEGVPKIYPVEAIAINFGRWETAGSYDRHLIDCHAHAHLLLTTQFINSCDDTFYRPLKGRVV